jgi:hypothetical protein
MAYVGIAFLLLVIMAVVLVFPLVGSVIPVLASIFPLAVMNIVGFWVIYWHFSVQARPTAD